MKYTSSALFKMTYSIRKARHKPGNYKTLWQILSKRNTKDAKGIQEKS